MWAGTHYRYWINLILLLSGKLQEIQFKFYHTSQKWLTLQKKFTFHIT
jgi:hypothetical protein